MFIVTEYAALRRIKDDKVRDPSRTVLDHFAGGEKLGDDIHRRFGPSNNCRTKKLARFLVRDDNLNYSIICFLYIRNAN